MSHSGRRIWPQRPVSGKWRESEREREMDEGMRRRGGEDARGEKKRWAGRRVDV